MVRIYCDTNIFLDFLKERQNKFGKPLDNSAFTIFSRALSCEFHIIISGWLLAELRTQIDPSEIMILLKMLERKTIRIKHTLEDVKKAKGISTHFADALHIILAKNANADMIVTRNIKDFKGLFKAKLPEDV